MPTYDNFDLVGEADHFTSFEELQQAIDRKVSEFKSRYPGATLLHIRIKTYEGDGSLSAHFKRPETASEKLAREEYQNRSKEQNAKAFIAKLQELARKLPPLPHSAACPTPITCTLDGILFIPKRQTEFGGLEKWRWVLHTPDGRELGIVL